MSLCGSTERWCNKYSGNLSTAASFFSLFFFSEKKWTAFSSNSYEGTLLLSMLGDQFHNKLRRYSSQLCSSNVDVAHQDLRKVGFSWCKCRNSMNLPLGLKLKRWGRERPFGKREFGSRSSSKNGWTNASNCQREKKQISLVSATDFPRWSV